MNAESCLNGLIDKLHQNGRPRVWSLIITVFGDAIVPRGGVVTLNALQQIMGGLGIEQNAVRTALSRLTKDGWLIRIKEGRTSSYSLAEGGESAFETATRRIYQKDRRVWRGEFDLVIQQEEGARQQQATNKLMRSAGYGILLPGLFIKARHEARGQTAVDAISMKVTEWNGLSGQELSEKAWSLRDLAKDYRNFMAFYEVLNQLDLSQLTSRQSLSVRTLLIHDWRRIILRDPALPDVLLPTDWTGFAARKLVSELYHHLLTASEAALNDLNVGTADWDVMSRRFS